MVDRLAGKINNISAIIHIRGDFNVSPAEWRSAYNNLMKIDNSTLSQCNSKIKGDMLSKI